MSNVTYRDYQLRYIDNIKINQSNLIISTIRSGKSLILKGIIDKYFSDKKVLIITNRRSLTIQLSKEFKNHTFILSGMEHDNSHNIHLATTQTFIRRDYDLNDYDVICVDEIHETFNTKTVKLIRKLTCTRIYMTGTPINSKGNFLGDFDNILEYTSTKQMINEGYLAPTRFLSRANILSNESEIGIKNGDYADKDIERIIHKQDLINWLVKDNKEFKWSKNNKCILYANSISIANRIVEAIDEPEDVKVIHSKLSKAELQANMKWFDECKNGILVNCRMYTVGINIPTCDTIINMTPTRIISLYLQSVWRASTYLPDKIATVVDYSGSRISPFYDDWHKKKKSCKEQCKGFPVNSLEYIMCISSCKSEPVLVACNGELPYSMRDSKYVSNFKIHQGKPCNELHPVYEYQYKTTEPTLGIVRKWSKCKCGCVTSYDIKTLESAGDMIQLYNEEIDLPSVTVLYQDNKALAILDDPKITTYNIRIFESSEELYKYCIKYFKNKPFTMLSNIQLKLPNIVVNTDLDVLLPLINWEGSNENFIKKIIKIKLKEVCVKFGYKEGMVYYLMPKIDKIDYKRILNIISNSNLTRSQFLRLNKELQGD